MWNRSGAACVQRCVDESPPPIPAAPPWPAEFVAALHAGCYGTRTGELLTAVESDADGRELLDALDAVVALLRSHG